MQCCDFFLILHDGTNINFLVNSKYFNIHGVWDGSRVFVFANASPCYTGKFQEIDFMSKAKLCDDMIYLKNPTSTKVSDDVHLC